ncbi:hypothetical protein [Hyalangium versicolor]|uniref:hypothetical protein n=1 Tax=Hyalangium versicolor TaxID=2861190 RepID=UPI001CCE55B1|nr:hypothetical protein [Hyalangium versicolor]
MHKSPHELRQMLEAARSVSHSPAEDAQGVKALREVVGFCPAFVPGRLALSRAMLLNKSEVTDPQAYFTEIEHTLRDAVEASGDDVSSLIELAHFTDVVRDAPQDAEPLFAEAAQRALTLLEAAWAGQIGVLGQQDKLDAALKIAEMAGKVLPQSSRIREAVEFARQCSSR